MWTEVEVDKQPSISEWERETSFSRKFRIFPKLQDASELVSSA